MKKQKLQIITCGRAEGTIHRPIPLLPHFVVNQEEPPREEEPCSLLPKGVETGENETRDDDVVMYPPDVEQSKSE